MRERWRCGRGLVALRWILRGRCGLRLSGRLLLIGRRLLLIGRRLLLISRRRRLLLISRRLLLIGDRRLGRLAPSLG